MKTPVNLNTFIRPSQHMKKNKYMKQSTKLLILGLFLTVGLFSTSCSQAQENKTSTDKMISDENVPVDKDKESPLGLITNPQNWNELSIEEAYVIVDKGTEYPNTGEYVHNKKDGLYLCKRCNAPLFDSKSKFNSGTGWPSYDDFIDDAVEVVLDADGYREEIVCRNCKGHLGHVFYNEGFTNKNTRHCVNSISLNFVERDDPRLNMTIEEETKIDTTNMKTAIFASGCFWGTEYFFEQSKGVISTQVGYIGGTKDNPTYEEVCANTTGHAEAVKVIYNADETDYETLCKLFFETHDPTQVNRQGPDIGEQYRTEIFYLNLEQKEIAERLKKILEEKGLDVATKITDASDLPFWDGEDYHEHYYSKKGGSPYCHIYTKRFD